MKTKILNTTCSILILIFLSAFGFQDNPPPSGWYQQFMPDLGRPLTDITFTDSLTGYAILSTGSSSDTNYIMKTSDGGDNWNVSHVENKTLRRIIFLNNDTGYVAAHVGTLGYVLRTTNGGTSWSAFSILEHVTILDMHILNNDTMWIVCRRIPNYEILRTTNGGALWTIQLQQTIPIFDKIYMYDGNLGFVGQASSFANTLYKTTNSGLNWIQIPGQTGFRYLHFADSLVGWKTLGDTMKFTTNGGFNWTNQTLPVGGNISSSYMTSFYNLNKDTIWGVGGFVNYGVNGFRGILHFTSNKGMTWYYQIPDTSIRAGGYRFINFINNNIGWAYSGNTGIHTKTGGDTTFYTGIVNISNEVPSDFKLHQNYPNPFNPRTVIRYALTKSADVTLKVYDVTGREYTTLVNDFQRAGVYEVDFMGKFSASGVYFYRLSVGDFSETKRMIMIR